MGYTRVYASCKGSRCLRGVGAAWTSARCTCPAPSLAVFGCWSLSAPSLLQVIRIQPNEAIYLKVNNKVPGLGLRIDVSRLDLSYKSKYNTHLPGELLRAHNTSGE